ncbi:MAG: 5-(carboxyamino)imidazole ribonucleotide synthase [Pseudomonadota bacterium]
MTDPLAPGATIGILGGGQLGRMMAMAAAKLGLHAHIFEPALAPAAEVACKWTQAPYDDHDALKRFASSVDVVTYEFENVPAAALDLIEDIAPIRPGRRALKVSQNRLDEKAFLQDIGLATAPYAPVPDDGALADAVALIGRPAILKTCRLGYDGKGQSRINDETLPAVSAPSVLEGFVDFTCEISVIAARSITGTLVTYTPGQNIHEGGILRTTTVPANLPHATLEDARKAATLLAEALDYVGVMGVEFFVTPDGLIVNEFAPRVHNSGHWTEAGCTIDQFEMHIRAVAGWPLLAPYRHSDVVMENLIGDDMERLGALAGDPNIRIHLYGKAETRPGRKMGHVTRITGPA